MTTHQEAQRAELPPSYKGSTLASKLYGGASVNFHFDSVEEAEAWHRRVTVERAKAAVPLTDAARLDWLCQQYVTVRTPLRYGSRECFLGSPDDNDGEFVPRDIRKAIDAAMAAQKGGAA